ncbi:MAG TPA: hypothetical protein VFN67_33810 [Polyangiales bacterium]|nr:hypothetical protein [Polyangiales bacterium]
MISRSKKQPEAQYYLQRDLLDRGWSKTAIARVLGEPDERQRRYGGGVYCRYLVDRVHAAERERTDWRKSEKRSASAVSGAETKREQLLHIVEAIAIEIPTFDPEDHDRNDELLVGASIEHYNDRNIDPDRVLASETDSPEFLRRITVNYLRHRCTPYDAQLSRQFGKVGNAEARLALLDRIYDAIADRYPHLSEECRRQLSLRSGE